MPKRKDTITSGSSTAPISSGGPVTPKPVADPGIRSPRPVSSSGPTPPKPVADPGIRSKRPVADPGIRSKRPTADPGIRSKRPVADPGIRSNRPVADPGIRSKRPVADPGIRSNRPTADPGIRSNRPTADPGIRSNRGRRVRAGGTSGAPGQTVRNRNRSGSKVQSSLPAQRRAPAKVRGVTSSEGYVGKTPYSGTIHPSARKRRNRGG